MTPFPTTLSWITVLCPFNVIATKLNRTISVQFQFNALADPAAGYGGPRNMKSMWPPLAVIFFMTYFYRDREGHGHLGPLDPLLQWPDYTVLDFL